MEIRGKETIYENAIIRKIMQLPRGTFREIQKKKKTEDLLTELERGRFSGICSISCPDGISTLVLKSGKCILAEYTTFKGDAALEFLHQALAGEDVDAALSTLDEAQIQLSMEFNKPERITKTGRVPPASQKTVHLPPVPPAHQSVVKKTGTAPEQNLSPTKEEAPTLVAHSPESTPRTFAAPKNAIKGSPTAPIKAAAVPVKKEQEIPATETTQTDFENDLDTLNSMNLDQMSDKMRDECKTMVKHLRLDHLMDKD